MAKFSTMQDRIQRAEDAVTYELLQHRTGLYESLHLEEALQALIQAQIQIRYAQLAGKDGR